MFRYRGVSKSDNRKIESFESQFAIDARLRHTSRYSGTVWLKRSRDRGETRTGVPGLCDYCKGDRRSHFLARKGKVVATFGDMFRLPSEKWKKKGHINRPIRQRVIVLSLSIKPAFQNLLFRIDYELYQVLVYRFFLFQYLCGITNFNTFTRQGKQSRFTVG